MPDVPHSLEAERAVLGGLLLKPSGLAEASLTLVPDDFMVPAHRVIFEAMLMLDRRNKPVDVIELADQLTRQGDINRLEGGEAYFLTLTGAVPTGENLPHYARIVKEKATLRRLIATSAELGARAGGDFGDFAEFMEDVAAQMSRLVLGQPDKLVPIGEMTEAVMDELERRAAAAKLGAQPITGVATGITKLDELTTGFQPGELWVIAAEDGGGKTAFAGQVALRLAMEGGSALAFQLEMMRRQLAERAFAHRARINGHDMRSGRLGLAEWSRLHDAAASLRDAKLYFEDRTFRLGEIVAKARRWRAKHPGEKGLVVVDYIQLARVERQRGDNRAGELRVLAQVLKELAKELGVPVIAVSQFSREGKKAEVPSRHNLGESGGIENAADGIILIHNPDDYEDGTIDLILDKNRNGPKKTVRARWTAKWFLFTDPDGPWQQRELGTT